MTQPNKFTKRQETKIRTVGRKIEQARLAQRLSIRGAAERTRTSRGSMTEATWRRVERGYTQTNLGNITYRPSASTLMAMAEVVGLDGEELCLFLELTPPPEAAPIRSRPQSSIDARIDQLAEALEALRAEIQQGR